ncbi:hypothetical protein T484DRAFT_2298193 [Baffinella frigidus]|nr:hypothetical protein T484DRAFT_2298193 [Cryptophyta sp. CCMP2293]
MGVSVWCSQPVPAAFVTVSLSLSLSLALSLSVFLSLSLSLARALSLSLSLCLSLSLWQELFIGSLPIKTKAFYLVNLPWWLEIPMKLVMVFIGKKLRDRMRFVSKRWRKVYREVADQEFWPSTMGGGGKPIEEWPCEKMDAYVAAYQKHATTSL